MRVPVVDARGVPVLPCTPPTARAGLRVGTARPKRNEIGLVYLQLTDEQTPTTQPLMVGMKRVCADSRAEGSEPVRLELEPWLHLAHVAAATVWVGGWFRQWPRRRGRPALPGLRHVGPQRADTGVDGAHGADSGGVTDR